MLLMKIIPHLWNYSSVIFHVLIVNIQYLLQKFHYCRWKLLALLHYSIQPKSELRQKKEILLTGINKTPYSTKLVCVEV